MKPLILITNDDSIEAKGLRHLVDCVRTMGDKIGRASCRERVYVLV